EGRTYSYNGEEISIEQLTSQEISSIVNSAETQDFLDSDNWGVSDLPGRVSQGLKQNIEELSVSLNSFSQLNTQGSRNTGIFRGNDPDIIFVIDVSSSMSEAFEGAPIGDLNGDNEANTRLDAAIEGFIRLNRQLISQGLGEQVDIAVVVYSNSARNANMSLAVNEQSLSTKPSADVNGNGISDVEEIIRSIRTGAFGVVPGTNPEAALQQVEATFNGLGTADGDGNVIFLTDGGQTGGNSINDEITRLTAKNVKLNAFGIGSDASLDIIQEIDPTGFNFTSTNQLLGTFDDFI
ncbi:MAG: VWA domain-containing protein, partial [Leptolyngbya sp. SIO3F4]|nr:VWA domain-containing protein [Leptolyngbya sp. SIO3F4]